NFFSSLIHICLPGFARQPTGLATGRPLSTCVVSFFVFYRIVFDVVSVSLPALLALDHGSELGIAAGERSLREFDLEAASRDSEFKNLRRCLFAWHEFNYRFSGARRRPWISGAKMFDSILESLHLLRSSYLFFSDYIICLYDHFISWCT